MKEFNFQVCIFATCNQISFLTNVSVIFDLAIKKFCYKTKVFIKLANFRSAFL